MLSNSAIRSHIREAKTFQIASTMQTNRKIGMVTMDEALLTLYQNGDIDKDMAISYAQDAPALGYSAWPRWDNRKKHCHHHAPGTGQGVDR